VIVRGSPHQGEKAPGALAPEITIKVPGGTVKVAVAKG